MVVLWPVVNGCPLWINVLPGNEQQLSSKAHGELGQRRRSVAVPDVTTISHIMWGEKVSQKALQVPEAGDFH